MTVASRLLDVLAAAGVSLPPLPASLRLPEPSLRAIPVRVAPPRR
jgi:hypothetical protein